LTFSPQTGALTLGNDVYQLRADADGITETALTIEIQPLVEGTLTRIDERLLGFSPLDMRDALPMGMSIQTAVDFPIINGRMYHIQPWLPPHMQENTELRLDSFDLATGEHTRDQLIHDFSPETILHHDFAARGLTVYTEVAAYLFDHDFELLHRLPWPELLDTEAMEQSWVIRSGVLNDDFTLLAFVGEINDVYGIYLLDLATGTQPTLWVEQALIDTDRWGEMPQPLEWPTPLLLLDDGSLLISVGFWTGTALFRLVDSNGIVLEEFPFGATGAYGGGYAFVNTSMVIFEPQREVQNPHYFDFEEGILRTAEWWGRPEPWRRVDDDAIGQWNDVPENVWHGDDWSWMRVTEGVFVRNEHDFREGWTAYIPDPNNPRVWYVSNVTHSIDWADDSVSSASILRLDFEGKTVETILTIQEMHMTLMAVGGDGELVFAYSGQTGGGFAVFTPTR
jgi:hypothetical protein